MKGKIIFIFSTILLIVLGVMMYMKNYKHIKNDSIPLIFMGIFTAIVIVFIGVMIKTKH